MSTSERPQDMAARLFMAHKGYPHLTPTVVDKVEGMPCWYYRYQLPEGELELEVLWDEDAQQWMVQVWTFERKAGPPAFD